MKLKIKTIVNLQDVRFRWPEQQEDLLHIPELVVNRGEHLFIQGPSGNGKTTLLNLLTGINLSTAGAITVLGTRLAELSNTRRDQFRADHLGVIFQQFNLLPYLSLLENVQLPCGFSQQKKSKCWRYERVIPAFIGPFGSGRVFAEPAGLQAERRPTTAGGRG